MARLVSRVNGQQLRFDSSVEQWDAAVLVTDHPVEDGGSVSDHAQRQPLLVTLTGTITETPMAPVAVPDAGPQRVDKAKGFLFDHLGELVDLVSDRFGVVAYMAIQHMAFPVDNVRRLEVTLQLKQVRRAEAAVVVLPVEVASGGTQVADTVEEEADLGTQAAEEDDRGSSALYAIGSAVGLF